MRDQASMVVVPQRAVLVLPSTGEFDSRTWRIAGSLAARGHAVTVLARLGPGLTAAEVMPAGQRILRVPVDAVSGLPTPLRQIAHRLRRAESTRASVAPDAPAASAPATTAASATSRRPLRDVRERIQRLAAAAWRLAAIGLTIRSQRLATRRLAPPADLVHAMAYMGIPVGLDVARRAGARVVYDARDIYTEARNIARMPGPMRWTFARIERSWARRADRVFTVNEPYADELARRLGVERPFVVLNCSLRRDPPAIRPRRFHAALGLPPDRRIVLYHGGLSPDRGIEQLIAAIPAVPNATLVLMGYGVLASAIVADDRVVILPAVPPAELIDWVASADVAAMPIQPTTLNHRLTTPNKLFEAIAADVPIVASDLPGMAPIIESTGCGVVVDPTDPTAIAAAIRAVLDAPPARRMELDAGLAAARAEFNWDRQMELLVAEYGRLTGKPW
jgi:glycogen(starch) synthase